MLDRRSDNLLMFTDGHRLSHAAHGTLVVQAALSVSDDGECLLLCHDCSAAVLNANL